MATSAVDLNRINTVTGKVTLKESGVGIPDLLIVLLNAIPQPGREGVVNPSPGSSSVPAANVSSNERIGSVITDKDGVWAISFDDTAFQIVTPTEKRPDLQLMVLAPEDSDADTSPVILYASKVVRINSGRHESYLIRITADQLKSSNIPLPPDKEKEEGDTERKIQQYRRKKEAQKKLKTGISSINKEFEEAENSETLALKSKFRQTILPNAHIVDSMYNFVKETDSVENVQKLVYKNGATNIDNLLKVIDDNGPVPGKGIKINLILNSADKEALQEYKFSYEGKDYYNIPEAKIQALLFKRETDNGVNAILFSNNPISKYCMEKSADEKCAELHTGLSTDNDHHEDAQPGANSTPANTPPVTGITKEDVPVYLAKILTGKDFTPNQNNNEYRSQRPDGKSIQDNVNGFALQKGPADTTAFYDFHSLQIAFDYVWQQLLDETIVNLAEKIHNDQENAGQRGILKKIQDKTSGIRSGAFNTTVSTAVFAFNNTTDEVPTEISSAFDISFLEYDALTSDNKEKLSILAKDINTFETGATVPRDPNVVYATPPGQPKISDYATVASVLRDQGERIIDNIRISKPYTTNALLKELQERLLSKYEFTVFAADKDYHSINFGVMNTFRQKWEPISYQAGKLVKTIPLSPKEERKYSVKTTESIKAIRKQAQKNNSSLQQEVSTTSRAESEIVARAHDKSNFNLSVKLDYSKITSEANFGKEAEKESSQAKKEFREAVIKTAQEFKDERSLEIDTEQSFSSEYSESGTIVNPNDELSVTYLFYELQRRYRISEQLYRVMPVVLVAQEVPSPDQITEAWIIAHDWILNRVLLDDSFRSTLQYIAQKNVGDDFAIRELRKNLRQQRTLVNQLQIEFSKLKQDVENKYTAMETAVQNRISEEHQKRFRWWWWWNGQDRPDSPPDPEMAKALEQAATDEHKYAVEKAEKMSLAVQREVNALHQLTLDYNNTMRDHLDRIAQTRRLITHVKENILYYMQAIWSMEPPDQRYMRLYKVSVPQFEAERTCIVADEKEDDIFAQFREAGKEKHTGWLHGKIKRNADGQPDVQYKQLVEVADLDSLLGFKGNYMIFPLKQHNALTELMAAPYIDEAFGAMDPDQLSNINLEEFSRYICCLHDHDPAEYERLREVLKEWLKLLLSDPLRNGDEIIIPTGSLFIEMLPSDKSLLEDFKLKHREWDVYKVQAEVRKMELENIRYAARLLHEEREDPDVDRKIVVEGSGINNLISTDVN